MTYSSAVSAAVSSWRTKNNFTLQAAAEAVGIPYESFKSRLYGQRRWSVDDLGRLAAAGVDVPMPARRVPSPGEAVA